MARKYQELMMTPSVQAAQRHYYGRTQSVGPPEASENTPLSAREIQFIGLRDSFYLGSVTETGWPYVQHRGGPTGFLRVLNPQTVAFDDLLGNCQLLSTGNLAGGNDRVSLFLMDYPNRARLKIIGHARVLDANDEPQFAKDLATDLQLLPKVERVFVVEVVSFDWNCPKYITPRFTQQEVEAAVIAPLNARIRELEKQLASLSPASDA